jgi:hypothetical protein
MVSRKPSSGDTPRSGPHSARIWGRVVESADHHHEREALGTPTVTPPGLDYGQHAWVKVENVSGAAAREGECLEFEESAVTELNNRKLMVKGLTPNTSRIGWGITLAPVADDEVGRLLLVGSCKAFVTIKDETHKYATRKSGSRVLDSAATGPVKILHKPTGGTPPEERECVVQLADEVGPSIKLIYPNSESLPAAYGGPSHLYDLSSSGGLVESYGNYVAGVTNVVRRVRPVQCTVWGRDSNNDLAATSELVWAYNPGGLPLPFGWYWAEKDGDLWRVTGSLDPFSNHSAHYQIVKGSGTANFNYGEAKFLHGSSWGGVFSGAANNNRSFTFLSSDVFITHPGTYKITFGATVSAGSGSSETATNTDSAGHTVTRPRPRVGHLALWKNFNPDLGDVLTQDTGADSTKLWRARFSIPPDGGSVTVERTVDLQCKLADWHGGPYTRLNLSIAASNLTGSGSGAAVTYERGWLNIQAVGDNQSYFSGPGYNQYLGTSGAFQWYGGGPAPAYFDENGDWL